MSDKAGKESQYMISHFELGLDPPNRLDRELGRDRLGILKSRERKCAFSLDFRPFGPSVLDRVRSKVALRGEDYAWTPIWWSSDNSKR